MFMAGQFDLHDPVFVRDPYPTYARLREEDPVHQVAGTDLWVVSRYDDVVAIVRAPEGFSSALGMGALVSGALVDPRLAQGGSSSMADLLPAGEGELRLLLASDPPDHTRLRRLVNRPFTPRAIAEREPMVRLMAEQSFATLVAADAEGSADWIRDFAWPFPVMVIAELMGIPVDRRDDFKRWSDLLVGALGGASDVEESLTAFAEVFAYFAEVIEQRRSDPRDDLISVLVHNADDSGEALSAIELATFCLLLLVAGNETTTNLLGNGMRVLIARPDLVALMRDHPESVNSIVEEMLRFDCPLQAMPRGTTNKVRVGDVEIPPGATVLALFGSANRDPRRFAEPDVFDAHRNPTDHLAFGLGIHLCLGAPLARLEARVAFETLARYAEEVALTGESELTPGGLLRGVTAMPVSLIARADARG
jgi:cytochrome P450